MRSTLTIFFAGFGVGLMTMCLWIGLGPSGPVPRNAVAVPVVEGNTNLLSPIHWKRTTVTFHRADSNHSR
jgi:hypothetical protein